MKRRGTVRSIGAVICIVVASVMLTGSIVSGDNGGGACCLPDGECINVENPFKCESPNGDFQGIGIFCESVDCPKPPGTIIVGKQTEPDGSVENFSFSGDLGDFGLRGGEQQQFDSLQPGNYTVSETVPDGWELTSIVCDDGESSGLVGNATAVFQLQSNETVTCTFTNSAYGACCGGAPPSTQTGDSVAQGFNFPCQETIEANCTGSWNQDLTCEADTCDPEPGACISDQGICEEIPLIDCPARQWVGGPCPKPVPTVTEWGLALLVLFMAATATWFIRRRKRSS